MCEQIASIPTLAEDAVICLFRDSGRGTQSSLCTTLTFVIETVVNGALAKSFRSVAF